MFESAKTLGFSDEAHARDLCQLQFLAQLMRQGADRFILKGGMAMRALYGSARLTKDIDFDCEDSVSTQSIVAVPHPNSPCELERRALGCDAY
jgi:predicted nucleotidyltransferase component of viral defense system